MKIANLMGAIALGGSLSLAALADDMGGMHGAMGGMNMGQMEGMDKPQKKTVTAHGVGTIKAIDAKAPSLTLAHGPVAEVRWPAMTMTFKVAEAKLLKGLKPGRKVAFTFESSGMEDSTITDVKPVK